MRELNLIDSKMRFLLFPLLFQIIYSKANILQDYPSKPENYDLLFDDITEYEQKQLYGCKESYQKSKNLKNCILGLYSCTFTDINVDKSDQNVGVIRYIINSDMQSTLTGNIEFQSCKFTNCIGGCVHIECSDDSRHFSFLNCGFYHCKVSYNGAGIYFGAMNGKIEKCHFYNCMSSYDAGHISFHPPNTNTNEEIKFFITNNVFEMRKSQYIGCVYLVTNTINFEFSNNQINIINYGNFYGFHFKGSSFDFSNLNIKNNYMFPFSNNYFATGNGDTMPQNAFLEGNKEKCPTDLCENVENCEMKCETSTKSERIITNSILKVYNSYFNNLYLSDDSPGAAIYISISNDNLNLNTENPIEINGCLFTQCNADKGGAIYISSSKSNILFKVEQCTFAICGKGWSQSEFDTTYGAAICIESDFLIAEINSCYFDYNVDCGHGSGICYCFDFTSVSNDDVISSNNDYSIFVNDCVFTQNQASDSGGAIFISFKNGEPLKPIEISNCVFCENSASQNEGLIDLPEMGGAISILYDSSSSSFLDSNNDFLVRVINCDFTSNLAYDLGGSFYIEMKNGEPSKPIEINHCLFAKNKAELDTSDKGNAGDFSVVFKSSSSNNKALLNDNTPSIRFIDNIFTKSYAKERGGSMIFSILNSIPTKSIEINNCSFNDCSSRKGYSIELTSSNPTVLLHFYDCKFSQKCSIWFNSISGYFEKCTFTNMQSQSPIIYDCYSIDSIENNQYLKIEKCHFIQSNQLNPLISFVPKAQSNFYFHYNDIEILDETNNTWVFGCDTDATLLGNWDIVGNTIFPPEDKFINNQNALKIGFPASCEKGFICGELPSSSEEEISSSSEELITSSEEEKQSSSEEEISSSSEELITSSEEEKQSSSEEEISSSSEELITSSEEEISSSSSEDESTSSENEVLSSSEEEIPSSEEDLNCKKNHRCSLDGTGQGPFYLNISFSNFNHIHNELDGGAIHLTNYGIFGIETIFNDCISKNGGGGGIFFYLNEEIANPFDLTYINFTECKAVYGGAIYIYSNVQSNEIKLVSSRFIENEANKEASSNNNHLFGGGGIFLHANNVNISYCSFIKNAAAGVKVYNNFDNQQKSIKEIETIISVSNSLFDFDDKTSSSSFYYVSGDKKEMPFEIENCNFIGKLKNKEKHIDGVSLSTNNRKSRLIIKSCTFSSANKSFEINSMEVNFKEMKRIDSKITLKSIIILSITFLIGIALIILTFFVVFDKKTLKENNESINQFNFA